MTNYVIPDHGLGAIRNYQAAEIRCTNVTSLVQEADEVTVDLAVILKRNSEFNHFDIHFRGQKLGELSKQDADLYPELHRIADAGLQPQVTARATASFSLDEQAEPIFNDDANLIVRLPRPGICLPQNNPPTAPWALVDDHQARTKAYFVQYDTDAPEASMQENMHLLATLHKDVSGELVACIDGRRVGTVAREDSEALAQTIAQLEQRGLVPVVRGFHTLVLGAPQLTLWASDSFDFNHLAISPFPALKEQMASVAHTDVEQLPATTQMPAAAEVAPAVFAEEQRDDEEAGESVDTVPFSTNHAAEQAALAADSEEGEDSDYTPAPHRKYLGAAAAVGALALVGTGILGFNGNLPVSSDNVAANVNKPQRDTPTTHYPYSTNTAVRGSSSSANVESPTTSSSTTDKATEQVTTELTTVEPAPPVTEVSTVPAQPVEEYAYTPDPVPAPEPPPVPAPEPAPSDDYDVDGPLIDFEIEYDYGFEEHRGTPDSPLRFTLF